MERPAAQNARDDELTAGRHASAKATATSHPAASVVARPTTFATLPADVQLIVVDQILASSPMGNFFGPFVCARSPTASTLMALRRVSRPWQVAVDARFPGWHVTVELLENTTDAPLPESDGSKKRNIITLAQLPCIPADCVMSLEFVANRALLAELSQANSINSFVTLRAPNVDVSRVTAWQPRLAKLSLRALLVWESIVVMPMLMAWSATLTSLTLTVAPDWNRAAVGFELPFLHSLDISIDASTSRGTVDTDLKVLPIAPRLQSLKIGLCGAVLPEAIAQYADTLRALTVAAAGIMEGDPLPMPHWPVLRSYSGYPHVFFQIIVGRSELPALSDLSLWPSPLLTSPAHFTIVPCGRPHLVLPKLTKFSAGVALIPNLKRWLVMPQLTSLNLRTDGETAVPDLPWLSLTTVGISNALRTPQAVLKIHRSTLDALPNLGKLRLPEFVTWIGGASPTLRHVKSFTASPATFASFPNHALPALEEVVSNVYTSPLRILPAACMDTLRRISAPVAHPLLVGMLSRMPRLEYLDLTFRNDRSRMVYFEWRLAYLQGNPVWSTVPAMALGTRVVDKLVIDVGAVNDVESLVTDIGNMARWCANGSLPANGGMTALLYGGDEEGHFLVDVHVKIEASVRVRQRVEELVVDLQSDGIVARVVDMSVPSQWP